MTADPRPALIARAESETQRVCDGFVQSVDDAMSHKCSRCLMFRWRHIMRDLLAELRAAEAARDQMQAKATEAVLDVLRRYYSTPAIELESEVQAALASLPATAKGK